MADQVDTLENQHIPTFKTMNLLVVFGLVISMIGFALQAFYSQIFTTSFFGLLSILSALVMIAPKVAGQGIQNVIARELHALGRNKRELKFELIKLSVKKVGIGSLLFSFASFFYLYFLSRDLLLAHLMSGIVAFASLNDLLSAILKAEFKPLLAQILGSKISPFAFGVAIFAFSGGSSLWFVLWVFLGSFLANSVAVFALAFGSLKTKSFPISQATSQQLSKEKVEQKSKEARLVWVANLAYFLFRLSPVLLAPLGGELFSAGLYLIALKISSFLLAPRDALTGAFVARLSFQVSQLRQKRPTKAYFESIWAVVVYSVPIAALAYFAQDQLLGVLEIEISKNMFLLALGYGLVNCVLGFPGQLLVVLSKERSLFLSSLVLSVTAISTVAALIFLSASPEFVFATMIFADFFYKAVLNFVCLKGYSFERS